MTGHSSTVRAWLAGELQASLAQAFETMVGVRPEVHLDAGVAPGPGALVRRQKFAGLEGSLWLGAAEADWTAAGNEVMHAAGVEDSDAPTLKSTYLETIGQALSALASSISARIGSEVTCGATEEGTSPSAELAWDGIELGFPATKIHVQLALDTELIEHLGNHLSAKLAAHEPPRSVEEAVAVHGPPPDAKTFDLLLDVELPVSVSFGRAQVMLKDLIKLTTGSIVELNRSISEPVEVIVNNCVIARGEVVVVEGNFGVRIQQVVSRQERLRTLV